MKSFGLWKILRIVYTRRASNTAIRGTDMPIWVEKLLLEILSHYILTNANADMVKKSMVAWLTLQAKTTDTKIDDAVVAAFAAAIGVDLPK